MFQLLLNNFVCISHKIHACYIFLPCFHFEFFLFIYLHDMGWVYVVGNCLNDDFLVSDFPHQIVSSFYVGLILVFIMLTASQRFQKCEYAKTKLFKTEGRGWGLLADEDIKVNAYQSIIDSC